MPDSSIISFLHFGHCGGPVVSAMITILLLGFAFPFLVDRLLTAYLLLVTVYPLYATVMTPELVSLTNLPRVGHALAPALRALHGFFPPVIVIRIGFP
jgi:CBS domain containing-hemolysin-like protein